MCLVYYGRNLLLIVAKVKEALCPQRVAVKYLCFL